MIHNKHLWPYCRKYGWRTWCLREEFLDNLCSLFPIQIMKTARASLSVVSELLQDSRYYSIKCTDGCKSLHTILVKHYTDLLDRQSFERGKDEVTFFCVGVDF